MIQQLIAKIEFELYLSGTHSIYPNVLAVFIFYGLKN